MVHVLDESLILAPDAPPPAFLPRSQYVARYRSAGRRLSFVAVHHMVTAGSRAASLARRECDLLSPEEVIVEGWSSADEAASRRMIERLRTTPLEGRERWGESMHTAALALERGITVVGGEAPPAVQRSAFAAGGRGDEDMLGYFVLRGISMWVVQKRLENEPFDDVCAEYLGWVVPEYAPDLRGRFSAGEFHRWFVRRFGQPFPEGPYEPEDGVLPWWWTDPLVQKLFRIDSRTRDVFLAGVIARSLESHHRVVVVYGAGHHATLHRVLSQMLGEPEIVGE
ncbi:MAG: hypothetical protein HY815_03235 [Candidatus Riflebacteria bacterium]|nr:hypothetical protein [Candidatus Riflebacteria bacterium]